MQGIKGISVEQHRKENPVFQLNQIFGNHDSFHFLFLFDAAISSSASRETSR